MKTEDKIDKIVEVLLVLVESMSTGYYDSQVTGLTHDQWLKCINTLREVKGLEPVD